MSASVGKKKSSINAVIAQFGCCSIADIASCLVSVVASKMHYLRVDDIFSYARWFLVEANDKCYRLTPFADMLFRQNFV